MTIFDWPIIIKSFFPSIFDIENLMKVSKKMTILIKFTLEKPKEKKFFKRKTYYNDPLTW
jgi:hypothetical protein